MNRIGAIVRKLYSEELKPAANNSGGTIDRKPGRIKRRLVAFKKALSDRRTVVWMIRIFVILVVVVAVIEAVFQYNRLMAWYTVVMARRADVDRELQRRENLIPNMVFAVSKYAGYEQRVFRYVSDARETLQTFGGVEMLKGEAGSELEKTLSRLIALAEEYPDLKATQSIQDLIKEAANTENRIADVKEEYNKASEVYNQYRTIFPGNVFAFIYRFEALPYIGLKEELKVPLIDLKMTERRGDVEEESEKKDAVQ